MDIRNNSKTTASQQSFKFLIKVFVVFAVILGISISAIMAFNAVDSYQSELLTRVEQEKRSEARLTAENLVKVLEYDISEGNVDVWDDLSLHEWALTNIAPVRNGSPKSTLFMVNVGYSTNEFKREVISANIDSNIVTNEERGIIIDRAKAFNIKGKSNSQVHEGIYVLSEEVYEELFEMNKETKVTFAYLNDLYISVFFTKEGFIYDGTPTNDKIPFTVAHKTLTDELVLHQSPEETERVLNAIKLAQKTRYGDNYYWDSSGGIKWLEWAVSPDTIMGYSGEPSTAFGITSVDYKKIVIVVGTQAEEVMSYYTQSFNILGQLRVILTVNVVFSVAAAIVVLAILFLNIIKEGERSE